MTTRGNTNKTLQSLKELINSLRVGADYVIRSRMNRGRKLAFLLVPAVLIAYSILCFTTSVYCGWIALDIRKTT